MPRPLTTADTERAYRRGVLQTCARLHDLVIRRCSTFLDAVELLGRAEDAAREFREGRADPGPALLDELETRATGAKR